ncbi:MAG: retron St85 family RNA-directed DNA polymerase [Promethearchaeota archaeon]
MPTTILGNMSEHLLIPKEKLEYLIRSSPYRYKVYQIPKRSGGGLRTIAQPAREVKKIQYWVIKNIFPNFPVHQAAAAYVPGKNILKNAEKHSDKPYLLKLDFHDFFPSIKGNDFLKFSQENNDFSLSEADLRRLIRILFWLPERNNDFQLSIGAPSSPFLSNAIMYNFDSQISNYCAENNISYTRYADDLAFSMHDMKKRGEVLAKVEEVLASQAFPILKINNRKTVFGSKAHRRIVTGLILTNDGAVSLGRDRKRRIRAQIHHMLQGKLSKEEINNLRGMLAFARDIEPEFVKRMGKKYGKQVVKKMD